MNHHPHLYTVLGGDGEGGGIDRVSPAAAVGRQRACAQGITLDGGDGYRFIGKTSTLGILQKDGDPRLFHDIRSTIDGKSVCRIQPRPGKRTASHSGRQGDRAVRRIVAIGQHGRGLTRGIDAVRDNLQITVIGLKNNADILDQIVVGVFHRSGKYDLGAEPKPVDNNGEYLACSYQAAVQKLLPAIPCARKCALACRASKAISSSSSQS